ncbi:MAG: serine hydrolase domain-containing protein [Bacteroidota bacterium]
MKRILISLTLFSFTLSMGQNNISLPSKDALKAMITESNVPALGIGTIENGNITNAFVLGETKANTTATDDAFFDTASIAKNITSWLTLKLVNEGSFDLDEPLYPYWIDPDIKDSPYAKLLTARHILGHKTGFKNWRWMNPDKKLAFDFEPGTKVQYSGEGFEYLKKAVENKFETTFQALVDQWVFEPFAMQNAHVIWDSKIDFSKVTIAHNAEGEPYEFDIEELKRASAADNLLITAKDLALFGKGIMEKEGISAELYQQMITPKSPVKEGVGIGLGWVVFENLPNDEYALLGAGSDQGVNAIILLLPESKRGLIALTNGDNGRKIVMGLIGKTFDVGPEILGRL